MSRTVTALYDSREEAERALHFLKVGIPVAHAGIYDRSLESLDSLQSLDLTREEHAAARLKLASGGHMLLAQVRPGEDPNRIVALLERIAESDEPAPSLVRLQPRAEGDEPRFAPVEGANEARFAPLEEAEAEAAPAGEQARVGGRQVVRGGTRVEARVDEGPVIAEVELIEELVKVETRPATRQLGDEELEQAGLLRDRLIEIAQVREEPVISRQAFVREEVVVTKAIERRIEQVRDSSDRAPPGAVAPSRVGGGSDRAEAREPVDSADERV